MAVDWKESLDEETRVRADHLIEMMEQVGAPDAEMWVRSEIREDIPQFARYLLLRNIGIDAINRSSEYMTWLKRAMDKVAKYPDPTTIQAIDALKRLLDSGADIDDIAKVARYAVEAAIFRALVVLDNGFDDWHKGLPDEAPGWAVAELDAEGNPTGRLMGGLHESFDTAQQATS